MGLRCSCISAGWVCMARRQGRSPRGHGSCRLSSSGAPWRSEGATSPVLLPTLPALSGPSLRFLCPVPGCEPQHLPGSSSQGHPHHAQQNTQGSPPRALGSLDAARFSRGRCPWPAGVGPPWTPAARPHPQSSSSLRPRPAWPQSHGWFPSSEISIWNLFHQVGLSLWLFWAGWCTLPTTPS